MLRSPAERCDGGRSGIAIAKETDMCLTCGCGDAHLVMGDNITYEDLKRIAGGNGKGVQETLEIIDRTAMSDRENHPQEYTEEAGGSSA
jgi:hypothetical protein